MADIVTRTDLQVRHKTCPKVVQRYAADLGRGASFPPILCARVDGVIYVVDGFHRLAAYRASGAFEVLAEVFEGTLAEAKSSAAVANLGHGQPLKPREVRNVLRMLIQAGKHRKPRGGLMSYREMAKELLGDRVSYGSVRNWVEEDFPALFRQLGDDRGVEGGDRKPNSPAGSVAPDKVARSKLMEVAALMRVLPADERGKLSEALTSLSDWGHRGDGSPWEMPRSTGDNEYDTVDF